MEEGKRRDRFIQEENKRREILDLVEDHFNSRLQELEQRFEVKVLHY